jgi:aerobic-type carbon monoxide dehydrogenase small subunit (CoxS/CutS family)
MALARPKKQLVELQVNGELLELAIAPHHTLLEVLREDAGLTGTKHGCELGECGLCTVLIDGLPQFSCLTLALEAQGSEIRTVEGLAKGAELSVLQQAYAEKGASQCGYCSPGMLMSAQALLERNGAPTRDEIREALAGNLCRCTGYLAIIDAVELAASRLRGAA